MTTTTTNVSTAAASIERKTKILRITLALTVLSLVIFMVTLASSHWIFVTYPFASLSKNANMYVNRSTYGIIYECLVGGSNKDLTNVRKCDFHQLQVQDTSTPAERTLVGMIRTMLSFSIIHIFLASMTVICGLYSIRDYRYTYKRLTGMIYILTAAALVVCIEVLSRIFHHSTEHFSNIYPMGTKHSYGPCYIFAWIIFAQLLVSSFIFFACSKKRKGTFDEATEEEALANRRVDLGRSFRA